ncbi:hypothetical protein L2E82_53701 [Cichorium intybus]|nr:hypothetical protein L2E82_53701 [Cichorium intybus]
MRGLFADRNEPPKKSGETFDLGWEGLGSLCFRTLVRNKARRPPAGFKMDQASIYGVAKCGEGPTLKCPQTASPHQAASIAKCSATKQALPNTTDAEVGKPEVAKEVGGRK